MNYSGPAAGIPSGSLQSLSSTSPYNTLDASPKSPNSIRQRTRILNSRSDEGIKEEREIAARSARQEVRAKVREDWEWPTTDPTSRSHRGPPLDNDTLWCERGSDSSSPPSSPEIPPTPDPYKFESPNSLNSLSNTTLPNKRKRRRRRLLAELSWNEGLNNYIRRRDDWTGGLTLPLPLENTDLSFLQLSPFTLPPTLSTHSPYNPTISPPPSSLLSLTPLPPPLLSPTNSIRASISPLHYPAIYSKIVLQGTTPSVPINLADMTKALVGGWIADGEWPPKPAALEAPVGKKRVKKMGLGELFDGAEKAGREKGGRGLVRGAGRVKRFLGMGREVDGNGQERGGGENNFREGPRRR